jgi:hypothetical protein
MRKYFAAENAELNSVKEVAIQVMIKNFFRLALEAGALEA